MILNLTIATLLIATVGLTTYLLTRKQAHLRADAIDRELLEAKTALLGARTGFDARQEELRNFVNEARERENETKTKVERKRLTNTPVRMDGSMLKCSDDRKNRVVSAQATYPRRSSAVGGRVCEQRYAAERILPVSRFELQHTGSPSKETALEKKA